MADIVGAVAGSIEVDECGVYVIEERERDWHGLAQHEISFDTVA